MSVPYLYVHSFREISLSVDVVESTVFDLSMADRMFVPLAVFKFDIRVRNNSPSRPRGSLQVSFFELQFNLSYTDSRNGK